MEFLVLSDSHGRTKNILEAISRQVRRPDGIIFLGDGLRDLMYCDIDIPIYSVAGNCDTGSFYGGLCADTVRIIELAGKRVMLTHGHIYSVKSTLSRLIYAAADNDIDIVMFGHTHEPLEKRLDVGDIDMPILKKPLYLFNPGSVGGYDGDFGALTVNNRGEILLSHGRLNK